MLRSCLTNGGEPRNREIFHMKEIVSEVGVDNLTTQKVTIKSKGENFDKKPLVAKELVLAGKDETS